MASQSQHHHKPTQPNRKDLSYAQDHHRRDHGRRTRRPRHLDCGQRRHQSHHHALHGVYTDTYGAADQRLQLTCKGVHDVKIGKTADASFAIDKFHCKVSSVGTTPKGNRQAPFAPNQQLTMSSFGSGWNSDFNGAAATSLTGQANAKGNAFSAVATYANPYPVS